CMRRAVHVRGRRAVGTGRVQGYAAWHEEVRLAGFFYFENFASFIVTAFSADTVRKFALVAVRTLGKRAALQSIVGAPGAGALLGVPPCWNWDCLFLFCCCYLRISYNEYHTVYSNVSAQAIGTTLHCSTQLSFTISHY